MKSPNITHVKYGSALIVGGIAAYQSYFHMSELITEAGQDKHGAAWVLPLSVDGLALTATVNMIQAKRAGRKPTLTSWVALGAGVLTSLAANVASAWDDGAIARVVAGWPAIAVMLVIELLARKGKKVAGPVDSSVLSDQEIAAAATPRKRQPKAQPTMASATAPVTSPSAPQPPTGPAPLTPAQKGWETRRRRQAQALEDSFAAIAAAEDPDSVQADGSLQDAPVSPAV